ncbi:MAG: hypothetical protein Q4P90_02870, partial [Bifidobacteriaceae bacterium]|nr:hypothetical protein [Bifidobacteriaceae bacterium]
MFRDRAQLAHIAGVRQSHESPSSSPNASPGVTAVLAMSGKRRGGSLIPFWLWQKLSVLCKNGDLKSSVLCKTKLL